MSKKGVILFRAFIVYAIFFSLAVFIMIKSVIFKYSVDDKLDVVDDYAAKVIPLLPNRGDICAEDGSVLSTSMPYYELRFDPLVVDSLLFYRNIDLLSSKLSIFFGDTTSLFYRNMIVDAREKTHNRYLRINKKRVNHEELNIVKQFPIFSLGKHKGGFQTNIKYLRIQPYGNLASRTIGYINTYKDGSFKGRVGLERSFEDYLKGRNGKAAVHMMSGKWVNVPLEEPEDGCNIITSINVDFQDIVYSALKENMEYYSANNGTAILMEVNTGYIKAIANLGKNKNGKYSEIKNYAINDAYEPGSVFKAASFMSLIDDGFVNKDDIIDLGKTGDYRFHGITLSEGHGGLGKITVKTMMSKSSNGISKLLYDNYNKNPNKLISNLSRMGLDKKLGIDIDGEAAPLIKNPKDKTWSGITIPWMSIGYELQMTPLQVLAFYNAIANGGQRMRPRFVKRIEKGGDVLKEFKPEKIGSPICKKSTLRQIQEMLEDVVVNGTAKNLKNTAYGIAGKTGTAKIAEPVYQYSRNKYLASFVGYFPASNPKYSCIVVIKEPSSKAYYGNVVAGTVFKSISDKIYVLDYKGTDAVGINKIGVGKPIPNSGFRDDIKLVLDELDVKNYDSQIDEVGIWVKSDTDEKKNIILKTLDNDNMFVPNLKGMGLKDAVYLVESRGMKVSFSGVGRVKSQSIPAGAKVNKGKSIYLELK